MEDFHRERGTESRNRDRELGKHIRQLRTSRDMTLSEMALRCSISAASLSRIENGEASPNARTLGELAAALSVTISTLVVPLETEFAPLMPVAAQKVWLDESTGFERRAVSPPAANLSIELVLCRLKPGHTITYAQPTVPGQEHHLLVLEGQLIVTIDGEASEMGGGDCLRYRLFGASSFQTAKKAARYLLALRTDT